MTVPTDHAPDRCRDCNRILVPQREWLSLDRPHRKRLNRTHAKAHSTTLCARDYQRAYPYEAPDIAWDGGWRQVGMIRRPVGPRPVEAA